ncbi:ABC transporter ATP-binding protein [Streptomyces sp. NPDC002577]
MIRPTQATTTSTASTGGEARPAAGGSGPILTVEGLTHSYGDNHILRGLNCTVDAGEFVCIVGPSGVGKSTLLQCLTGLRRPTGGRIAFQGEEVTGPPPGVAVVFQDYSRSLMPWLTVARNVGLPLRAAGVPKAERRERAAEALREVGLSDSGGSYPWQLSGGMQQRVAIARALAYRPVLVVMDEPFASVDAQTRADLEDLTLRVRDRLGITVLLVTHDIDEAVYLSDKILVISGKPARVTNTVQVGLGADRDQISTKATAEFAQLRAEIYREIRGAQAPAREPAQVPAEPSVP